MPIPPDLLKRLNDVLAQPGGRMAAIGAIPSAIAGKIAARQSVDRPARVDDLASRPAQYRLILASGVLGRIEWDRWSLQQAHYALEDGGALLIDAPNLMAPASPGNLAFLVGRMAARLRRAAARPFGGGRGPRPFGGRRYRAPELRTMIESLGFNIRHWSSSGPGGDRFWILAFKKASVTGLVRHGGYPDCATHGREFESVRRPFLAIRDRWVAAHGEFAPRVAEAIDVTRYAGADVLVLAPHPDDEIIGCGGTLARLIEAGARVTAVQATDGAASLALKDEPDERRRRIRLDEARSVAEAIGFASVEYWGEPNGAFIPTPACVDRLHRLIGRLDPALIFTPFVTDIHEEHLALNRILSAALECERGAGLGATVMGYEVWSLAPAGAYCDVTDVTRFQESLLWRYVTAMKVDDFVQFCEARNFYHACTHLGRNGFAEAFHTVSAQRFPALVATVPAAPVLST